MRNLLELDGNISIVGERENIEDALKQIMDEQPDVLIWGSDLPTINIQAFLTKFQQYESATPILFYGSYADKAHISKILEAGVSGYLLRENALESLVEAVRALARGECWFSPYISELVTPTDGREPTPDLTEREEKVLQMMAWGLSNQEIAKRLNITIRTVKFHAGNIYQKLAITTRAEAIAYAWRQGIVNDSGEGDTK